MERAGRSLSKLNLPPDELARAAWPVAVGKRIALHAAAVSLVRERLVVEVEDAVWQRQLFGLRHQILHQLRKVIGDELIRELEFRIVIRRRPMGMAVTPSASSDDADQIED